jgi:hypothetical protein
MPTEAPTENPQQSGGPSEERTGEEKLRGQLEWVPILSNAKDFRSWLFKFRAGAKIYLNERVYKVEEERNEAFEYALLRAADKGGFKEMCCQLELLDHKKIRGDERLKRLEKRFLPALETEEREASEALDNFKRGGKLLSTAVHELQDIVLRCHKAGYEPESKTVINRLKSLVKPTEYFQFEVLLQSEREGDAEEKTVNALERLARINERAAPPSDAPQLAGMAEAPPSDAPQLAGRAANLNVKDRNKGPRRNGYGNPPVEAPPSGTCDRCGVKRCPCSRGADKEKCFAFNKICTACGKPNHYSTVCRKPQLNKASAAAAIESSF